MLCEKRCTNGIGSTVCRGQPAYTGSPVVAEIRHLIAVNVTMFANCNASFSRTTDTLKIALVDLDLSGISLYGAGDTSPTRSPKFRLGRQLRLRPQYLAVKSKTKKTSREKSKNIFIAPYAHSIGFWP